MANQVNTYSYTNAQSYLEEISRPMNKSSENSAAQKQSMNNSHRAINHQQAQMPLFGQLPNDNSFFN